MAPARRNCFQADGHADTGRVQNSEAHLWCQWCPIAQFDLWLPSFQKPLQGATAFRLMAPFTMHTQADYRTVMLTCDARQPGLTSEPSLTSGARSSCKEKLLSG